MNDLRLERACDLAHQALVREIQDAGLASEDELWYTDSAGDEHYKEKYQDRFNELYARYLQHE